MKVRVSYFHYLNTFDRCYFVDELECLIPPTHEKAEAVVGAHFSSGWVRVIDVCLVPA